ncbi:cysteine hydrolase family protein [Novosphingobium soli]|uniref:Cysteine hydrolase family protein n=1 Tax=Novosphingobium soli TaxID=574956 RepID=A0ABV6CZJ6_9SPHN
MAQTDPVQVPHRDQEGDGTALLIIDMINCFDFPGAEALQPAAEAAADAIERLRAEFEARGWPVVYVNDNFGEWHSERSRLVERALEHDNPVTQRLRPRADDFFIIKPQFSGFYATNLAVLLPKLGVTRLVLTGIATDICILFTAADAHMRDYSLWVPGDAVAAEDPERNRWALRIMQDSMGAETAASAALSLDDWLAKLDKSKSPLNE